MAPSRETKNRVVRIKLVDGSMINGQVNINKGDTGYDRLSDLLESSKEKFITIVNVACYQKEIEEPLKSEVLFLNKSHILWAVPEITQQ